MSILGPGYCDTCQWWGAERKHDDDYPYGTCRILPPKRGERIPLPYHDPDRPSAPGPVVPKGEWPRTAFDDWCADHTTKKKRQTGR